MQAQESLSVSRRSMDIEDFIDIARRHKAWIFGPTFAALVVSVVVAFLWPDTFLSTAIIRVVPPQVPESYVPANTTTDMQGRINGLTQSILNRATLTEIVGKHALYKKELSKLPMDDVIESMKAHDIKIGQVQTFGQSANGRQAVPAFMIGFQYSNRYIAQTVTIDLVSRFLSESTSEANDQTNGTTELLQIQWENAKNKLGECDQRLQAFRVKNMGKLPDEQQGNYSQLNSMQTQLISIDSQMSRITGEKLQLDNEMRITKQQIASLKDPNADQQVIDQKNEKLAQKDKEIEAAENYLARLRDRYKDSYPDVQTTVQQLALLRRQRDDIRKEDATKKPDVRVLPPNPAFLKERAALQANEQRLATMEEQKDLEMKELQRQSALITESL